MPKPSTESFAIEAWDRAGTRAKFGLPLLLDKRDYRRENILARAHDNGGEPYIVLHTGGISSPYPQPKQLLDAFKGFPLRVVHLNEVNATKPHDLLALLERARCAVLADSFPLHLSFACPRLPVIALQTDKPTRWFGAPKRQNWVAHYRYGESLSKLSEIVEVAEHIALRTPQPRREFQFPVGAYNASLIDFGGDRFYTWRYHPRDNWHTLLQGARHEGSPVPIILPADADPCSQEDARLFVHRGKLHVSYTLARTIGTDARCVIQYGELHPGEISWRVRNTHQVKYGRNDWSSLEKNHVFFSADDRLFCLYASQPEQVVLEIDGANVVAEHRSPSPTWPHGEIRGDVLLPYEGKLLRVFHSCVRYQTRKFRYFIGVSLLDAKPPFTTLKTVSVPLFAGDESSVRGANHSKANVVFCCGAIIEKDELIISLSRNDDRSSLERISLTSIFT